MRTRLSLEPYMWFREGMVMKLDAESVFGHKVRNLLPERGEAAIFNFRPKGWEPEWQIRRFIGSKSVELPTTYPTAEAALAGLQEQEDCAVQILARKRIGYLP